MKTVWPNYCNDELAQMEDKQICIEAEIDDDDDSGSSEVKMLTVIQGESIKSSPDYKHLLQENYVEYKLFFLPLFKLVSKKLLELHFEKKKYVCIPCSFLVINVCNQGKSLNCCVRLLHLVPILKEFMLIL